MRIALCYVGSRLVFHYKGLEWPKPPLRRYQRCLLPGSSDTLISISGPDGSFRIESLEGAHFMKGTVNPFEPWRPVEARIPPPLHAGRPWRPPPARAAVEQPPLVEPVEPLPRNKPPERPKHPQGRTEHLSPRRTPLVELTAFAVVVGVLSLHCLNSMGWLYGPHTPRLAALGVGAVLFAVLACNRRDNWHTRLTGMAVILAFAGIVLWFMPTLHGVSLWSAYQQVTELRALPAGDVAAYQRGAAARRTLVEDFPSFAADVSAAEQAWLRRTVDEAIENADRQLDKDPDVALAHLHQLDQELSRLEHYASVQKDLESAHRRAVQACLKVAQQR